MADLAEDFELGEEFNDAVTTVVEYNGDIIPGDILKVTGVNDAQQHMVEKQTTNTDGAYIAIYSGADGELHEVILTGTVKVTFGASVTVGKKCAPKANKIYDTGTTGVGGNCGRIISNGAADGDTGLIYFTGVGN